MPTTVTSHRSGLLIAALALCGPVVVAACNQSHTQAFISTKEPVIALVHVRVIDGSGAPGIDDQTIVIRDGRIGAVGSSSSVSVPKGAHVLDLPGHTAFPGLVGVHNHLFYQFQVPTSGPLAIAAPATFARLYLASGVTTIRTAGTMDFAGDVRIKERIDEGREPGPKIHITAPYLNAGSGDPDPEDIARQVAEWSDQGATSFKAYVTLRAPELKAAVKAAHDRGLSITGHLCAVGFREAAALGIDNLEHGLPFDTELYSGKQPDTCPDQGAVVSELVYMDIGDAAIRETIGQLIRHGVTLTSTLAVIESFTGRESVFDPRVPKVLSSRIRDQYLVARAAWSDPRNPTALLWARALRKEMEFERAFVNGGGRLTSGADPTGWGGIIAGFGDQRQLELLVEAGFSPESAIKSATANGATLLREHEKIGTIAIGKQADLVVVRGNPSARIADVRNVALVFKDGVAYDPDKLVASAEGTVGQFELGATVRQPIVASLLLLVLSLTALIGWRRRSIPGPSSHHVR